MGACPWRDVDFRISRTRLDRDDDGDIYSVTLNMRLHPKHVNGWWFGRDRRRGASPAPACCPPPRRERLCAAYCTFNNSVFGGATLATGPTRDCPRPSLMEIKYIAGRTSPRLGSHLPYSAKYGHLGSLGTVQIAKAAKMASGQIVLCGHLSRSMSCCSGERPGIGPGGGDPCTTVGPTVGCRL